MKHRYIIIILLVFSCGKSFPQALIDSLKHQYGNSTNDSAKIKAGLLLSEELFLSDNVAATTLINEYYNKIAETDTLNYLHAQVNFINLCFSKNNLNLAFTLLSSLKLKGIEYRNKLYSAKTNFGLARYYLESNDLKSATDLSFNALRTFEELKDLKGIAASWFQIALINYKLKNTAKAIEFAQKSAQAALNCKAYHVLANAYTTLGNLYSVSSSNDIALEYYNRALSIRKDQKQKLYIAPLLMNIGTIFSDKKQVKDAETYYKEALALNLENGNKEEAALCYNNLGNINFNQNNFQDAKLNYSKALHLLNENDLAIKESLFYNLAEVSFKLGHTDDAFAYQDSSMTIKDSLYSRESIKTLNEMQTKYETEKTKLELEKKELEANNKQLVIYAAFGGLALLLYFSFFVFRGLRRERKTSSMLKEKNLIINEQKRLVEEKNKDINDSIRYAQRIQSAILANEEDIRVFYPESFLFYKPKDIVAGDFYFFDSTLTNVFYAAADCTGHGVPGALVSVVCSNALSRCVKEFELTDPGKILDKARELVLETFKKSGQDVKDGMDISFLVKDNSTNKFHWAGANNPLWIIRNNNGAPKLEEIRPNKQPIGMHENPTPFTSHEFSLQKGDAVYLFTDGMPDQFGGPKGKKYKYKRLQEKLLGSALLSKEEQKKIIQQDLIDWMGANEQVDDILLIGFRV